MANNRMIMVCNKCYPTDEDLWSDNYDRDKILFMTKWYPIGAYYTATDDLQKRIEQYLEVHAHTTDISDISDTWVDDPAYAAAMEQNENPVRLTYETWVRDMPAIKKWEYKA